MRYTILSVFVVLLIGRLTAGDFTVHEWGTFTSVVGSDGKPLSGLEDRRDDGHYRGVGQALRLTNSLRCRGLDAVQRVECPAR